MRTQKNTMIATLLVALHVWGGLWAQEMVENEADTKWQSNFPDDTEIYSPMPLPEPKPSIGLMTLPPDDQIVYYDAIADEEIITKNDHEDIVEGWADGSSGTGIETITQDMHLLNFTDLSRVLNPSGYPWRVNCKLFFKQWDPNTQTVKPYVGSGILIDSMHVLTAGHCVHAGDGEHWSTDMVVVPGYENGSRPYGDARGVHFFSWVGWTQRGNFDDDIGIIRLDRPIGALTGWYGYTFSNNPLFYTETVFNNASYPAGEPFDGKYMYFSHGNFDFVEYGDSEGRWTGNEVGFYRTSYGGQSGSGVYILFGSHRYVIAVISNGLPGFTKCPRINATIFQDIEHYTSVNTPSEPDLLALNVQSSQKSVVAGGQLSSLSYRVHNYSSVSWSGTVNVSVYLSTNANISSFDTLIGTDSFWSSFGPKSTAEVEIQTPLQIPAHVANGEYWLGVILDISDYDVENNDSDGQEAALISVN